MLLGWTRIDVPGATGYLDTDYAAKGRYGVEALKDHDLVCVHVEAPDEASHEGRADEKVKALERIDEHIVGPLLEALPGYGDWRILVSPDHRTPLRTRAHAYGMVPFAVAGTGVAPARAADLRRGRGRRRGARVRPGLSADEVVPRRTLVQVPRWRAGSVSDRSMRHGPRRLTPVADQYFQCASLSVTRSLIGIASASGCRLVSSCTSQSTICCMVRAPIQASAERAGRRASSSVRTTQTCRSR